MRNNPKKDEIINAARKLFYENGYNETNLKDIAQVCGIKKQTISYYFNSKAHLGLAVYDRLSEEMLQVYVELAGIYEGDIGAETAYAASMIGIVDYYEKDAKAFRFFEQFYFASLTNIDIVLKEGERHYAGAFGGDPRNLEYISSRYASIGVLYYYIKGELAQYTKDEFCKYYVFTCYSPFIKDKEELEALYVGAKALYKKMDIRYEPYFVTAKGKSGEK